MGFFLEEANQIFFISLQILTTFFESCSTISAWDFSTCLSQWRSVLLNG